MNHQKPLTYTLALTIAIALFTSVALAQPSSSHVSEAELQALDCAGVRGGSAVVDDCGVCNGGNADKDSCGVCFGNNAAKDDCGVCFGNNAAKDDCGICFGNNRNKDGCGVCFGNNRNKDSCGVCFGNNRNRDFCGVCFGPATSSNQGICPSCPFSDESCLVEPCPSLFSFQQGLHRSSLSGGREKLDFLDPVNTCVPNPRVSASRVTFFSIELVPLLQLAGVNQAKIDQDLRAGRLREGALDGGYERRRYGEVFGSCQHSRECGITRTLEAQGQNIDACFICATLRVIGCFPPGERVQLKSGELVPVEKIRAGDVLLNPVTGEGQQVIKVSEGPEELPLIEFGFGETTLKVTQEHPILTAAGVKKAKDLVLGEDEIVAVDGTKHKLTVFKELPVKTGQMVINFVLQANDDSPDNHMLAAEGIVAGDLVLQNAIAGE